ncbi:MAG: lipocalin family protein, partial [Weeksellaceae bacterium]
MCIGLSPLTVGQFITLPDGKEIDKRLIGTWEGSEKNNQMEGMEKKWTMIRNEDGTFHLDFEFTMDGDTEYSEETGTWWIEDGKFHEYHDYSDETDIYDYEVLNKKSVKFKSQSLFMEMESDTYEFIDYKVKTKKKKNDKITRQDGLSFETALKVNRVAEEYEFV